MSRPTDFGRLVVGSAPIFRAAFAVATVATDPDAVTFTWRIGTGTPTTWTYGVDNEVVRDSLGHYSVTLPVTASGRWHGRWVGTGDPAGASELTFGAWTQFPEET